jgi:capsular polysaccharide biosynthesis protein
MMAKQPCFYRKFLLKTKKGMKETHNIHSELNIHIRNVKSYKLIMNSNTIIEKGLRDQNLSELISNGCDLY